MQMCGNFRLLMVHQVLRTMGRDFFEDQCGTTIVDDGQWVIFLPDDDMSLVVIAFNQETDPADAADLSMRFCRLLDLADLNIVVAPCFDSTGSNDSTAVATVC